MTVRIGITGAAGRMGRTLMNAVEQADGCVVGAALEHPQSSLLGADAGELAGIGKTGVTVVSDISAVIDDFDLLIDFTAPAATLANAAVCGANGKMMVIGTTGMSAEQQQQLEDATQDVAVCQASNFSTGVNLCFQLLEMAAKVTGDDYDVEVIEGHHRDKVDAPSGTALSMGKVVAETLGRTLEENGVFERYGQTGARGDKDIGFATIRAGDIVGDHTVMFCAEGERIEISHKASSRMSFGRGAIRAALWLAGKPAGRYDMRDVLGFK